MKAPREAPAFCLKPGASWLTPEGRVLIVPGFHEEWLRDNQVLAGGASSVPELIMKKGWISVTLFGDGSLELMVPGRDSDAARGLVFEFLSRNLGRWSRALVMSMSEEGYATVLPSDAESPEKLAQALDKSF